MAACRDHASASSNRPAAEAVSNSWAGQPDEIAAAVDDSGVSHGRAIVFAPAESCSIMVNERESGLLADLKRTLERLKATNGSGSRAMLGSSSVVLPVEDGKLRLGTWQRVLLVELSEPAPRSVDIQIIGEHA